MIFELLYESAQRGELILIEGGMCRWHLRKDGQVTIYEIISIKPGSGITMLAMLKKIPTANSLFAKCPSDLPANRWYARNGFICEGVEATKRGRLLQLWRYPL